MLTATVLSSVKGVSSKGNPYQFVFVLSSRGQVLKVFASPDLTFEKDEVIELAIESKKDLTPSVVVKKV